MVTRRWTTISGRRYFGIPATAPPHLVPRVLAVCSVLAERVGTRDIGAWIKAGYAKTQNNQTLFNIAAVREVVDDSKAQMAMAEADGTSCGSAVTAGT